MYKCDVVDAIPSQPECGNSIGRWWTDSDGDI